VLGATTAIAVVLIGVGFTLGLSSHAAQANPSKVWVVNDHVLQTEDGALCGGVCDPTTSAGRATFYSTLDTVQTDSSDAAGDVMVELCPPGCSLPPPAGNTWILVQTDGSKSAVSLNGRGLTCSEVAPASVNGVCGALTASFPDTTDHFIVYQGTSTGTRACGDIVIVTTIQDLVSLDSQPIVVTDGCGTPTPTDTPTASPTASPTATSTQVPATNTPTATASPATQGCLTFGQKTRLFIGIVHRLGAHQGERGYNPTYDVNHDGVIDVNDLFAVLNTPLCYQRRGPDHFGIEKDD
jgi:hypothetical protein